MGQFYKVLKADPLGDPWETHGKQMQSFWCQVEGQEKNVMVTKQVPNTVLVGSHLYGDLMLATSQKGNEYWKFKSAQVPEGVQRPADTPAQAAAQAATGNVSQTMPGWMVPIANQIQYIHDQLKKQETAEPSPQDVMFDQPDEPEPVDPETQTKLDEIFGDK